MRIQILISLLVLGSAQLVVGEILVKIDQNQAFVADEILKGIVPHISESWKTLKVFLEQSPSNKSEMEQVFWNEILIKGLKPYHESIREIDRVVLENTPSITLNPLVNLTELNNVRNLSERVLANDTSLEWLDIVKEGWVRISSLTSQIHWKYNWMLDSIFNEGLTKYTSHDFESILNDTLQLYYAWFKVPDQGAEEEQICLGMSELSTFAKVIAGGSGEVNKNMFHGLRALLAHQSKIPEPTANGESEPDPCPEDQTMGGKQKTFNKFIPVYVLLHLLNAEFKYYLLRNLANMYTCAHTQKCDLEIQERTREHLTAYYEFYYGGIVEAFNDKESEEASPTYIPKSAWRWRCDPPLLPPTSPDAPRVRDHKEGVTFTRLYDFETTFIADERNISLTQTCRESCDMFDGGYSSIPCEEDNWTCLDQEIHFDCSEKKLDGKTCPAPARTLCPNSGIKCHTTQIKKAEVCKGQRPNRFIEWIASDELNMGKKSECNEKDKQTLVSSEITERAAIFKYEPQRCEVCLCKCYEPLGNDTHRYISLLPQVADVENGFTFVGAKFSKVNNVIHIMIAEAKLVDGKPDTNTTRWIEPKSVNISDSSQVFRVGKEAKRVLLDDFSSPTGHVITGLRFVTRNISRPEDYQADAAEKTHIVYLLNENDKQSWHYGFEDRELALEVQGTPLSTDGILDVKESKWISNLNSSAERNEVKIEDPDEPTLSPEGSVPASSTNEFVVLQSSSLAKDAGQTPIPFFDCQELVEVEDSPITGFGLFYKGRPGFGGFLAFRFFAFHVSDEPKDPRYDLWRSLKKKENSTI